MTESMEGISGFQTVRLGSTPVIRQLIEEAGLVERIDRLSPVKKEDCQVSVGTRIAALIINQLSDRKPLFKVEAFYENQDVELLFGPGVTASDFNDDALGRALDALYNAGLEEICMHSIQGVQSCVNLTWEGLHADTTSFVYTGAPKNDPDDEALLKIVHGHTKDHRPDAPQIKFGLTTSPEGIPVYADVLNGNQDDKTWNAKVMKALRQWYEPDQLAQAIFIADSALVTEDNLKMVQGKGDQPDFQFLSRLPENFKVAKTLKEKALKDDENEWEDIGHFVNRKGAASYHTYPAKEKLHGNPYRFLVVQSDQMDGRKKKKIDNQLKNEKQSCRKEQKELESRDFACEADAEAALADFLKHHHKGYHTFEGTVVREEVPGKREKRGRPKKGEPPPPPVTVYRAQLELQSPSEETLEQLRKEASIFILVTNAGNDTASDVDLLKGYKGQQTVENRFRFLKDPFFVRRLFLEKPRRVEAFAYVMMMSMMIYSLFEYLIRTSMETDDEPLNLMGAVAVEAFARRAKLS
ncbi:IS1634 family transposase [Salicibibacter halophilus]|uniref:IS1634 family transposase n=1 Tax=Salicibibacter halophilus TaxID=2502791 RepID=A0A514LE75_9BACI|nr:IS1634 family transposase [Salicibibacter halophilus]QDI90140.1 IS1634 family transposase [Salicibibacter halophilus]